MHAVVYIGVARPLLKQARRSSERENCSRREGHAETGASRDRFLMFKLLRYFSLTSFVSVVVVAAVLGIIYREIAVHSLVTMGESTARSASPTPCSKICFSVR